MYTTKYVLSTTLSTNKEYFYRQNKPKNKPTLMGYNMKIAYSNNKMLIFDNIFEANISLELHISTEYITVITCLKYKNK